MHFAGYYQFIMLVAIWQSALPYKACGAEHALSGNEKFCVLAKVQVTCCPYY
jgi:hypothetical protein